MPLIIFKDLPYEISLMIHEWKIIPKYDHFAIVPWTTKFYYPSHDLMVVLKPNNVIEVIK